MSASPAKRPKRHDRQAETLIRGTGARLTRPRVEVLATLLAAEQALSHHELEERIDRSVDIDRVTIYRVLDWLTAQGLAHRIAGDDRVRRFNAAGHAHEGAHAHFQCERCGTVLCLEEFSADPVVRLPRGFRPQHYELTVKGLCAGCGPSRRADTQTQTPAQRQS
jgi:Fur family transcriptional regulator, ferric uptake regulator